jgi:hypothetical protein
MGLDIIMIGNKEVKEAYEDPEFKVLVRFINQNFPEDATREIGELTGDLEGGHPVGMYSHLHVLRGLALAAEQSASGELSSLSEDDFDKRAEAYYGQGNYKTRYVHLLNHRDDGGFYAPVHFAEPVNFRATVKGCGEPVIANIGSSPGLLDELDDLNTHLQMPGDLGQLGMDAFERACEKSRWPTAAYVWGVLRFYARESSERFMFVVFC